MVASFLLTSAAILATIASANGATKVVLTNDDGWAVANIRAKYNALVNAGFDVSFLMLLPGKWYSPMLSSRTGHMCVI